MRIGPMMLLAGALALPASVALGNQKQFGADYSQLRAGGIETSTVDGLRMQRLPNGAVRVVAETNANPNAPVTPRSDGAIVNQVRQVLSTDLDVKNKATQIGVSSTDGVVTLSGNAKDPHSAETAIRLALNSDGVKAVISELTWAGKHH